MFCRSAEELADVLRRTPEDTLITVQGARTGLAGGAVPQGGIILNLSRMDRISGISGDGDDCRMTVQAGAALERMEAEASAGGRLFPADPTEKAATAGGIFAAGAQGPGSLFLGQPSAYVQKLCWVTPRGETWRLGRGQYRFDREGCVLPGGAYFKCRTDLPWSPVRFGAARPGMDLIDFLAGSGGRLGVAAELTWRLPPKPAELWGILYFFNRQTDALDFADALRNSRNGLFAAEFYDEGTLRQIELTRPGNRLVAGLPAFPADTGSAVYVELCGDGAEAVETALADQFDLFTRHGGRDEDAWAESGARVRRLRDLRHAAPELVRAASQPFPRCETDFSGPPEKTAEYVRMYQEGMAENGLDGMVYGHVLRNRLHAAIFPQTAEQMERCGALMRRWADAVARDGGLLVSENGMGRLKAELVRGCLPPEVRAQLESVNRCFRPRENLLGG